MKTQICLLFLMVLLSPFALTAQEQRTRDENGAYYVVDEMPEFPGGEMALRKFIADNVSYPEQAKKDSIVGRVYISFVVDEAGKVGCVKVERSVNALLDQEALRVVKMMPAWKPGREDAEVVKVSFVLPISFALQ